MSQLTLTDLQQRRVNDCPKKYRTLYLKALAGEAAPRSAIKAKCYECMGWEGDEFKGRTLTQEVDQCQSTACPLHPYRPRLASRV